MAAKVGIGRYIIRKLEKERQRISIIDTNISWAKVIVYKSCCDCDLHYQEYFGKLSNAKQTIA